MSKPTIVLITCDELRKDALSCYGNQAIRTKHIDELKSTGTDYENCYTTSPWCLPARCSILTGLYPHKSGAYSNFRKCPLDVGISNLFRELKDNGYSTSLFGKCHFAPVPYGNAQPDKTLPYDDFKQYYESLGIDHLELEDDKQVSVWFYDDYSKELDKSGYLKAYRDSVWNKEYQKVFPFPGPTNLHPDMWVGDRAVNFIENCEDDSLFAWISFSGPHYPFDAPEEYWHQVEEDKLSPMIMETGEFDSEDRIQHDSYHGGENAHIDGARQAVNSACKNYSEDYWKRLRISYHANVKLIDDQVGKIVAAVQKKYGDNALIIFTADHGEMLGNHGLWGKNNCGYEEVWKIPMIVKFQGQTEGKVRSNLVNSTDILPTFLDAVGGAGITCDGISLYQEVQKREYTFAEGEGYLAVTDGRYKYIHIQKGTENFRELLDTKADPHEFKNCINLSEYQPILANWPKMPQGETSVAISKDCSNVEAALKFLNYGYTEEGADLYNWGVEGVNWDFDGDKRVYNDTMLNNELFGTEEASYIYKIHFAPKLNYPDTVCHANLLKSEGALSSRLQWGDDPNVDSTLQLPPFQLDEDQQQRLGDIIIQVNTYCDEMVLKFITGAETLDNFDEYVETIKSFGIEEAIQMKQEGYEAYMNKSMK